MSNAVLIKRTQIKNSDYQGHKLSETTFIGKSEKADLYIKDWKCDGIHALIKKENDDSYKIVDLGSYYGTKINNIKVHTGKIKNNDVITIGDQEFVFKNKFKQLDKIKEINKTKTDLNIADSGLNEEDQGPKVLKSELSVLEVSMFWGDQLLELKSFIPGDDISIGDPKTSDFGIPFQTNNVFKSDFILAKYTKGILKLILPRMANGLIWTDSKTVSLDTLRYYDKNFADKDIIEVNLTLGEKAHIEFGELALTFKFVRPAEKIKASLLPKIDPKLTKLFLGILTIYTALFLFFTIREPELKEMTLKDIPKHLKKVVYNSGIKQAKKRQNSAIGEIANNLGGRARSEEGKSQSQKSLKSEKQADKKIVKKKESKKSKRIAKTKKIQTSKTSKRPNIAQKPVDLNLDQAFDTSESSSTTSRKTAIVSKVRRSGNTSSSLSDSGFARGKSGLGPGGGGKSFGVGSLKGSSTGGGLGSGDYGLAPSKGVEISIPEQQEISIENGLDPDIIAARIRKYLPQIQHCYEQQLISKPKLRGKVTMGFTIIGDGSVNAPSVLKSTLRDSPTHNCMIAKIKKWKFPKPKGGGTVGVKYPFILMSNSGN